MVQWICSGLDLMVLLLQIGLIPMLMMENGILHFRSLRLVPHVRDHLLPQSQDLMEPSMFFGLVLIMLLELTGLIQMWITQNGTLHLRSPRLALHARTHQ